MSLSVKFVFFSSLQLFTVPTLAHHLIADCDVLAILLRTFMSECERKRNDRGKLEFQKNLNLQPFRRSVYILFDLKYLLTTTPDQVWTLVGLQLTKVTNSVFEQWLENRPLCSNDLLLPLNQVKIAIHTVCIGSQMSSFQRPFKNLTF